MADIFGTGGDDDGVNALLGTAGNDNYFGFGGRDHLLPTLGDDVLDGGADRDVAIYSHTGDFTNGVFINNTDTAIGLILAHTTDKRGFGTDTLIDIENFHGTSVNDEIHLGETADGSYTFDEWGDDLVVAFQGPTDEGNNFVAGPGNDTYVGSQADNDKIDYSAIYTGTESGVTVQYTGVGAGTATDPWGDTDTFTGIEEIQGTQQDDLIEAGDGDNDLVGFAGNDTLRGFDGRDDFHGGAGDDILDGGDGDRDEARYDNDEEEGGTAGVTVDLAAGTATDGFGDSDTLIGIEEVRGTRFADTIRGDDLRNRLRGEDGDDLLDGRGGNDRLRGGAGDNTLIGGAGEDSADYGYDADQISTGVTVDLRAGTATNPFGGTDTLSEIEEVDGTPYGDMITGDDQRNWLGGHDGDDTLIAAFNSGETNPGDTGDDLSGGYGNDTLIGSEGSDYLQPGAGTDSIDGGAHTQGGGDTLVYRHDNDATSGVNVAFTSLGAGTATDWAGDTDTFVGIENVRGTDFDDYIEGDDGDNDLSGGYGNDTLIGNGGSDYLQPGAGTDSIDGGAHTQGGGDTLVYRHDNDATSGVNVAFTSLGAGTATDWAGDTDTFVGIENVRGTDFDDYIEGDDGDNDLRGESGNDTLIGNGGDDHIVGGDGDDTMIGGDGGDYFRPGAGTDTITGGDVPGILGSQDELAYAFEDGTTGGIVATYTNAEDGTLQDWSGATDTFTGIEIIRGTMFDDEFYGAEGTDEFRGLAGNDYFDGGAGDEDEVDYKSARSEDGAFQGVNVNLVTGVATDAWGDTDTLVNIERVEGTHEFGDTIVGNDQSNQLRGEGGDDFLDSGGGDNNSLDGGEGSDTIISRGEHDWVSTGAGEDNVTVHGTGTTIEMGLGNNTIINAGAEWIDINYRRLDTDVSVDLMAGTTTKQGGTTDTFSGATHVEGGRGDDTILGGLAEYEAYQASAGTDFIDGRGGFDELRFNNDGETGVTVDMQAGTASGAIPTLVTFAGIESIRGSNAADTITGSSGDDQFRALGGADYIDGGAGVDRVDFNDDDWNGGSAGVTVDLAAEFAIDGFGDTDTLISIENARGTEMADTLLGSADDNSLFGRGGDDTLDGRAGEDWLGGEFGADILTGGADADVFYGWLGHLNGDTITDLEAGDKIAVFDDNWNAIGADIWADATTVYIDTDGNGSAEATMINQSGHTGAIESEHGPIGGPIPAVIALQGAGTIVSSDFEGAVQRTVEVTLTRSGDEFAEVTVDYVVAGSGSNPANADDLVSGFGAGSVTFVAGQTQAIVEVVIDGDFDIEANEMLSLTLTGVSSDGAVPAQISGGSQAFIRILNDDTLQQVDIAGDKQPEGFGNLQFTITRDGPDLSQALEVEVTFTGGDGPRQADSADIVGGLPQTITVTIAAGDTDTTINLAISDDAIGEFHESVVAQITALGGAAAPDYEIGSGQAVGEARNDDGIPPVPPGLDASSAMDPHLFTFDGLNYDFQAVGEFVLVESSSGDPLSIQVRYQAVPGSDLASRATAVATDVGGTRIAFDLDAANALTIDGVATALTDLAGGLVVGDGAAYFDGEALSVVYGNGEQLRIDVFDDFVNVSAFLLDGRDIQGLLGNADDDATNDLALRDGTVLTQPITFDALYGSYADSWRISDGESLFDYPAGLGTADYTDPDFPAGSISLDDLPDALLAAALAAASGIDDPVLKQAAMLDYALSGDADYFDAAALIEPETVLATAPTDAPELPSSIGVYASDIKIAEGNSGTSETHFTVYRTGGLAEEVVINYVIGGDVDNADIAGALSGSFTFAAGQTAQTISVDVQGDTTVEATEKLKFTFTTPDDDVSILSSSAQTKIVNDDIATSAPDLNVITGTNRNDKLVGTDEADLIDSLGGKKDSMIGGDGADFFVIGGQAGGRKRDKDTIKDYEIGIDALVLADGAEITKIRESNSKLKITFEGRDRDSVTIKGRDLEAEDLTIIPFDEFDFV